MMTVCEQTTHAHHLQQQQQQQQHAVAPAQVCPAASSTMDSSSSRCSTKQTPTSTSAMDTTMEDTPTSTSSSPASTSTTGCLPSARSSVEVPFLQDDRFYIYSCTVTFNPSTSSSSTLTAATTMIPSSAEIAFYCATILFNLALAHHQHAQRCPKQSQEQAAALRQALALYQESAKALHTLQQRLTPATLCCCADDLLLMSLALCNNQACILAVLQDDATACFQQLFVQSTTALQEPNNFSMFEQSQVQEFLRNAMLFGTLQAGGLHDHAAACA
eukprot:Sro1465_g274970.2  (274) ;mRNA; r:6293-7114